MRTLAGRPRTPDRLNLEPHRLQAIEERLVLLEGLLRKYAPGGDESAVIRHRDAAAEELAPHAVNVHFEDHMEDGKIAFDYRLRPGVVEKSNALALMRAVGLEV